jgi:malate dehydrogenase
LDVVEGLPQGKALDIYQSSPIEGFASKITGTNDYRDTAASGIVVVCSGRGRKPGMSRGDLLKNNVKIVTDAVKNVAKNSPDCIIVMVTNPVDTMTYLALKVSGFKPSRVVGLSGVLDSARLSSFIAEELHVLPTSVKSYALGEHGKNMIIIPRLTTVAGKPLTELMTLEKIQEIIDRVVEGGAEIVSLLKTGSAFYAPSSAATKMVEAIMRDTKEILPCAAYLNGEYGIQDSVIGVPVKLGSRGIEEIVEFDLSLDDKEALANSATVVRKLVDSIRID